MLIIYGVAGRVCYAAFMPLDMETRRRAYDALVRWWEAAGVDTPAPPPTRAPAATHQKAASTRKPAMRGKAPAAAPADPIEAAKTIAATCDDLPALEAALKAFDRHPLHASARNTVFARGAPDAPVMIVGEAPGRDEDLQGKPFVGRSGQLLDAMFAAIGLTEEAGLYISNILNWRPPGNRNPNDAEIALCLPFIERHIALKRPKVLVLAGGVAAKTLLRTNRGVMSLRGRWASYRLVGSDGEEIPVLPVFHPAFILRRPISKREMWLDLLALEERLYELGINSAPSS